MIVAPGMRAQLYPVPESGIRQTTEHVVFFWGRVALEDGSKPPAPVLIQRVCDGHTHDETWTDSQGEFSFKVDNSANESDNGDAAQAGPGPADIGKAMGNSTQYSNPITSALRNCDLQAVLAGFRSEKTSMSLKSMLDRTNVGTIVLHPLSRASALTVSATTLAAPEKARKAYEKGLSAERARQWKSAADNFDRALRDYPNFAAAWCELGMIRQNRNDTAGAIQAWEQALKADPKFVIPYEHLSAAAYAREDWLKSAEYSRAWIALDPDDFPAAYLLNSIANAHLNRAAEAERAARDGIQADKAGRVPRLSYVLGLLLMQKGENTEAVQCFHHYLSLAPNASDAEVVRQQTSKLEASAPTVRN